MIGAATQMRRAERTEDEGRRRKGMAQYFTAPLVVEFMFDVVCRLGESDAEPARVVDPACGAGAFLLQALNSTFTTPERIFGVEQDERMRESWRHNRLEDAMGEHLYVQDGLCDTPDGEVSAGAFGLVIGNPPFGLRAGGTLNEPGAQAVFRRMSLWRRPRDLAQGELPAFARKPLTKADRERLARFPVEILFVERFVELARPGGQIAIILPDGIISNARHQYVRDWVHTHCHIQAVISLPPSAFRGSRTTAKTSILFCRRRDQDRRADARTLLAAVESVERKDDFAPVLAAIMEAD